MHIRELLGVLVRKERSGGDCGQKTRQDGTREGPRERSRVRSDPGGGSDKPVKGRDGDRRQMVCRQGLRFGKTPTRQRVFIHASAVQGAEVLKIGTDARVQVMNDDARAQGLDELAEHIEAPNMGATSRPQ